MPSLFYQFFTNKFTNQNFKLTQHFIERESKRGKYSNLILFLKDFFETIHLKKINIDFNNFKNGDIIVLFDEYRLFKLVLKKEQECISLITVIHGATIENNLNDIIFKVNTRELQFLREKNILNSYFQLNKKKFKN